MTAGAPDQPAVVVVFEVPGPYGVKGSTMSFRARGGRIVTKTDCKHGRAFAEAVQRAARAAGLACIPKGTGVSVSAIYGFARPTTGKERYRLEPCVRPDTDKLARALLDALTGIAYDDDGQVVALSIRKVYADLPIMRVMVMSEARA